jgi:hypothetical protein
LLAIAFDNSKVAPLTTTQVVQDELCLQREMDKQWGTLLTTMAPSCIDANAALTQIDRLLQAALGAGITCPKGEIPIPRTIEESLDVLPPVRNTISTAFRIFGGGSSP